MYCPYCRNTDSRVLDSRVVDDGAGGAWVQDRYHLVHCRKDGTDDELAYVATLRDPTHALSLDAFVEGVLHKSMTTISVAFILGGIVMLVVERSASAPRTWSVDDTSVPQAAGVGFFQVLALVPGVSRSGATIVGGMLMGLDRATAAEFSFFLAMPTLAATFAHSLLELRHQITADRTGELVIGFVMAFVASAVVVKPFLGVVRRHGVAPFAWYRILSGVALLIAVFAGWMG